MTQLAADIPQRANVVKVAAATAIVVDLIQVTPVDSSKALSNWQVGLGSKVQGTVDALQPGKKGSTHEAAIADAISLAYSILSRAKPGESIWISNNLPYIQRLDEGYSTQAPAGFVDRAVLIGRKTVQTVKF
jgi:hypothetical protein